MRLIDSITEPDWNKKYTIICNLRELQELYCAISIMPEDDIEKEWKTISPNEECPFNIYKTFRELGQIIKKLGGYCYE